ncbi:MAG: hypothetical protein K0R37_2495, partial [Arthrobacter sp.]|nr:hypothetical protein [Arthrobacter sp.]
VEPQERFNLGIVERAARKPAS